MVGPHPAGDSGGSGDLQRDQPWVYPLQILQQPWGAPEGAGKQIWLPRGEWSNQRPLWGR